MKFLCGLLICTWICPVGAQEPPAHVAGRAPDSYRYANELLPAVVSMVEQISQAGALERKRPEFVALSKGKDEFVYHLQDKVFIRCIKNRYESPSGRVCGDFAVVRVELLDDSMKTLPPLMAWDMVYRDGQWQKLIRDEDGRHLWKNFSPIELPPYAVHCFEPSPSAAAR